MKTIIYCLSTLILIGLLTTSCEKDIPTSRDNAPSFQKSYDEGQSENYEIEGLSHNGQWFVVQNEDYLPSIISSIEAFDESYEAPEEEEEETDEFVDAEPLLENIEMFYGHQSYRKMLSQDLHLKLEEGQRPVDALNSLEDLALNTIEQTLLNEDKVIQVGQDLYYYYTDKILIKVANEDEGSLNEILDGGLIHAYHNPSVSFVSTNTFPSTGGSSATMKRDCSGAFTFETPTLDGNGKYNVIFTWAEKANLAAWPGVTLTWDFGDNTPTVSNNSGTVTHAYDTFGSYTVTLTVSGPSTAEDPGCQTEFTTDISFVEISTGPEKCEDALCKALNIIGLGNKKVLGNLLLNSSLSTNDQLFFTLSSLPAFALDLCEIHLNNITWVIDGTTYTGSSVTHNLGGCIYGKEIVGIIRFGGCEVPFSYKTPTECDYADCKQGWDELNFNNNKNQICYKTVTLSNKGNLFLNTGNNRIKAEMVHLEQKKNNSNKYKRAKANLRIETHGTLGGYQSCNCDNDIDITESASKNNKKTLSIQKKFNGHNSIHMGTHGYNWFADFMVDGVVIVDDWDASSNCN